MQFMQDGGKLPKPKPTNATEFVIVNRPPTNSRFVSGEGEDVYDAKSEGNE